MPKILRIKTNIKFLLMAVIFTGSVMAPPIKIQAKSCQDLKIIFARGSGEEQENGQNYLDFKDKLTSKLLSTELSYEFVDLEYPAVGVGIDKLGVTVGAYFGGGESYEFGESVDKGVRNLIRGTADASCPDTKYVIGGYSQGAMVISKALNYLNADKIIYAATFGDPKIYLPEGEGTNPAACRGENLSDYRMYVPDCQAYKGLLGAYIPYEPTAFAGKLGTWCNKEDIFCSSYLNVDDHTSYVSDNLYEDASRVIFSKIIDSFGLDSQVLSPHQTVFLFDSTGSMATMIDYYKNEALRLASKTLETGGQVALFDYRDLNDPYSPVKHCDFDDCTLEKFQSEIAAIRPHGGGDTPESLLSAAKYAMQNLNWKNGATKSLMVVTDADFLSPDRDGTTVEEVINLSKSIDPVNIYIITDLDDTKLYEDLAKSTDGKVVSDFTMLDELTDYVMERYDSLPRVEETVVETLPEATINDIRPISESKVQISFTTDGVKTLVILNDTIIGLTEEKSIIVDGLRNDLENKITLVPVSEDRRGMPESAVIELGSGYGSGTVFVPKAPNTGRL